MSKKVYFAIYAVFTQICGADPKFLDADPKDYERKSLEMLEAILGEFGIID